MVLLCGGRAGRPGPTACGRLPAPCVADHARFVRVVEDGLNHGVLEDGLIEIADQARRVRRARWSITMWSLAIPFHLPPSSPGPSVSCRRRRCVG